MKFIIAILILVMASTGYFGYQKARLPDGQANSSTSEQAGSGKITEEQAIEIIKKLPDVKEFVKDVPNAVVEVDNELEGHYNVHVYEIKAGHTATFNWYQVVKNTGSVKKEF